MAALSQADLKPGDHVPLIYPSKTYTVGSFMVNQYLTLRHQFNFLEILANSLNVFSLLNSACFLESQGR